MKIAKTSPSFAVGFPSAELPNTLQPVAHFVWEVEAIAWARERSKASNVLKWLVVLVSHGTVKAAFLHGRAVDFPKDM